MSSFPFLPGTIGLVDKHSGIYQGTRRCRCSRSTGIIAACNVQIERSRCTETSADAEHFYLITYTPECRLPAPHLDHQRGSGTQRGIIHRHVLDDHAFDVQQSFELALQLRRFLRLYFLVEDKPTGSAPHTFGFNGSLTNHHPRKQHKSQKQFISRHQTDRRSTSRVSRTIWDIRITTRTHPTAATNQHHPPNASRSRHPSARTSIAFLSSIMGCAKR